MRNVQVVKINFDIWELDLSRGIFRCIQAVDR